MASYGPDGLCSAAAQEGSHLRWEEGGESSNCMASYATDISVP